MSLAERGTSPSEPPGPPGRSLRAQGVGRRFVDAKRGTVTALEEVDLSIEPGEFVCLLGPSGCGKSTLLSILGGLDRPTSGHVYLGERAIEGPLLNMGFAFQRDLLLDWRSALDNVLLPFELRGDRAREHRARAQELLDLAGLRDFAQAMPSSLSGGMRQRVALCRTLVADPDVLLMDEPFAALDAFSRERMNEELLRLFLLRPDRIGLFVTHSIDEAVFLGTRILVMSPRPGRIVADHRVSIPPERTKATRTSDAFLSEVKTVREVFMEHGDQDWAAT